MELYSQQLMWDFYESYNINRNSRSRVKQIAFQGDITILTTHDRALLI